MAFPPTSAPTETSFASDGTTHNASMPATVNSGDLLLVFISLHYTSFNSPATIQTPSGWTEVWNARHTVSSNVIEVGVYARISNGTEGSTTVDFATSGTNPNSNGSAQCYRITDWFGAVSGIEAGTENNGASANPDPPSLTPSWGSADTLWFVVAGAADDDATVSSYPSLFGNGVDTTSGASANNRSSIGTARRESTATVLNPGTFTLSEAELWISQTVAVRPADAATLLANTGSYALTGNAADTFIGHRVEAEEGSYTLSGQAAGTLVGHHIAADVGSYTLTGNAAEFTQGSVISAEAGSYALTGNAATLTRAYHLLAESGSYTLTGQDASTRTNRLAVLSGSYALTGTEIVTTYVPVWTRAERGAEVWTVTPRGSETWTKQ